MIYMLEQNLTVTSDSITTTALTYTTAGTNGHLFKLLLVPANVSENNADIVAVITIELENTVRNVDSDQNSFYPMERME